MNSSRIRLVASTLLLHVAATNAAAADFFNPENGHTYRLIPRALPWDTARVVAFSQTHEGLRGHLATITSAAEQAFIESIVPNTYGEVWLGGFQPAGSPEPDGNWQWVSGEQFEYANWRLFDGQPAEPNDLRGEYLIEMRPVDYVDGVRVRYWNDLSAFHLFFPSELNHRPLVAEFTPDFSPRLNGTDLLNWQRDFGAQGLYGRADFNGDGVVDLVDLDVWKTGAQVPEPATTTLLVIVAGIVNGLIRSARRSVS